MDEHRHEWAICECGASRSEKVWAALYLSGKSARQIAADAQVNLWAVYKALRPLGILRPYGRPRLDEPRLPLPRLAEYETWKAAYLADARPSIADLAERFGVTFGSMQNGLRKAGTSFRPNRPNRSERDAEIIRLRVEEKLTYAEIGERYGITRERARQVLAQTFDKEELHALVLARTDHPTHTTCDRCGEQYEIGKGREHWAPGRHLGARFGMFSDLAKWRAIADDYADPTIKVSAIKAKWDIDASTLGRIHRHFSIPLRRPDVGRKTKTNAEALARKDAIAADVAAAALTRQEIADRHGCSERWVSIIAKQRGLSLTRSDAMRLRWQRWRQAGAR